MLDGPGVQGGRRTEVPSSSSGDERRIGRMGRFTVLHEIARGGMGVVFEALDERLDRKVAIKLLHGRAGETEHAHERMIREARAMAKLSHPNVVQVHEVGDYAGRIFVAMEYVQGRTLRQWLEDAPRSWKDVLEIFRLAGQGLAAAHRAGIVHRDFKPENVIVSSDGRVKVLDFGLACWQGQVASEDAAVSAERPVVPRSPERSGRGSQASLTKTGSIMGTPAYMSPEQHKGHPADARSDQFSFCVALYEALYGTRPFEGDSHGAVAKAILEGEPRSPPTDIQVPRWLHRILMRGLSREASERFPSMEALLGGFQDFEARVDTRNVAMLRLETGLGTPLMLAFWLLDWLFLPEYVFVALVLRLVICSYAVTIFMLCRRRPRWVERHVTALAFSVNLVAGWGLSAIVWLEGGLESAYYAGLNLLVLCIGIMFLWTIRRALVLNGLIYAFYMSPLLLGLLDARDSAVILSNQFFLLSTIIITVAAQHQRYSLERREFQAEQERVLLREEIDAMMRGGQRPELYNRAQFLLLAEDELARCRRYQRPLSCLVLGIDGVVDIGARHGDSVVDEILVQLGQRLVKDVRQFDLVGRYHGDEFVLLLPETEPGRAREVADRLIGTLARTPAFTRAGTIELKLSAGMASLSSETQELSVLLAKAIEALEQAKHEGGMRTIRHEELLSTKLHTSAITSSSSSRRSDAEES
ncbi:protein kinase domain-containing protein [Paraliomyxa miuraensis]|uniref:protein kinase domain-containing protein n=1 Tax=Paraliomyxa miuraensis TaxID=376150 RepID=UPI00224F32F1|nr:protein kinase [Paraliomyxa miuraensis]MCX4242593.1 protein kinase [Paraliomyxa miuraensis]